ncbi:hypothetical protein IWX49DRAFT_83631 [Phyllosticta citricarpa]|uniref:Uncharacterized protein n=1 Tax=Phyllosticta citricarpa TaxID=55181 RepID=A0ABR1MT70_9PEZI
MLPSHGHQPPKQAAPHSLYSIHFRQTAAQKEKKMDINAFQKLHHKPPIHLMRTRPPSAAAPPPLATRLTLSFFLAGSRRSTFSSNMPRKKEKKATKRTTAGIRCWSPTQLLIGRKVAYLWKSGRGSEFSTCYGRTWKSGPQLQTITKKQDGEKADSST